MASSKNGFQQEFPKQGSPDDDDIMDGREALNPETYLNCLEWLRQQSQRAKQPVIAKIISDAIMMIENWRFIGHPRFETDYDRSMNLAIKFLNEFSALSISQQDALATIVQSPKKLDEAIRNLELALQKGEDATGQQIEIRSVI